MARSLHSVPLLTATNRPPAASGPGARPLRARLLPTAKAGPNEANPASQARPIRVAIADDRALVHHGLRLLLGGHEDIELLRGTAGTAAPGGQLAAEHPDVLVLDLSLTSRSAITAVSSLRERAPQTQIVVLTGEREPLFARRVLAAGALGFVARESADDDLPAAIRASARGKRFVSASVATALAATRRPFAEDRLTVREIDVLRLIALGHTSAETANVLALSPRTVETNRARIHKKLGLTTRAEIVSYALRRRLLRA
jgi:two-component system response regulator NreC